MSSFVANSLLGTRCQNKILQNVMVDSFVVNGLVVLCLTMTFSFSGAFDTDDMAVLLRAMLWAVVSILMVFQISFLHRAFLLKFSSSMLSRFFAAGLALATTSLLMSLELHWLKYTPLLPKEPDPFIEFLFFVAPLVIAVGCLILLSQSKQIQRFIEYIHVKKMAGTNSSLKEFEQVADSAQVLHVRAQDHYLELNCPDQRHLVRGRMKDAINHLGDVDGIQVHRSHWVSKKNIRRVIRQGRDFKLILNNGDEIPVARSRSHLLK